MPRVTYALPMQGFRPRTNPSGALGRLGLRGLGATDATCDQAWAEYHAHALARRANCKAQHDSFVDANPHIPDEGKTMWQAFVTRYPDCGGYDVWADFLQSHPGCAAPQKALHGLGRLGDGSFSGCVSAVDGQGNPVSCSDPSAAVWFDADMNAVPAGTQAGSSPSTAPLAGAPTGSSLLYSATWQLSPSHGHANQILASVLQILKSSASVIGLQVVDASQDAGLTTVSNFNVRIQLFVNGPGFGQPNDAGSFVDHAYNQVTGLMPVVSATVVTARPAGVASAPAPTGTSPFPTGATSQTISWLESNALWVGLGIAAIVVLPGLVKKL
jgi:hypothetical protein